MGIGFSNLLHNCVYFDYFVCVEAGSQASSKIHTWSCTPVRRNSHRHMLSSSTRENIDPLLRSELTGHVWVTDNEEFINRFFDHCKHPTDLPTFPNTPQEANVTQWIKQLTKMMSEEHTFHWEFGYGCDGQRPSSNRWPDVFILERYNGNKSP